MFKISSLLPFNKSGGVGKTRNKLVELLTPSYLKISPGYVEVDEVLHKVLCSVGYPRTVRDGWLSRITGARGNIDTSIHIKPISQEGVIRILEEDKKAMLRNVHEDEMKGSLVPDSLLIRVEDTVGMIRSLEQGDTKAYHISMYLDVREDDLYKLKLATKEAEAVMNSMRIQHKQAAKKHDEGLLAVLPLAEDTLGIDQMVPTQVIAANFPFTNYNIPLGEITGVLQGYNLENGLPIIVDRTKLSNRSKLVVAGSGGGKSYSEKLDMMREIEQGTHVYFIDPNDEYGDLAVQYGGQVVTLGMESKNSINIFDLTNTNLFDKLMDLDGLWALLFGGGVPMTPPQIAMLDKAVRRMYAKYGITLEDPGSWNKQPYDVPILGDLYNELVEINSSDQDASTQVTTKALINRLERYVKGPLQFMNKHTNVDLRKQVVVFNYHNMPKTVRPIASYIISKFILSRMEDKIVPKRVVIDEAGYLLRIPEVAEDVFKMSTQGRKFNLGVDLLVQGPVFLGGVKDAVMANISLVVLLPVPTQKVDEVAQIFKLTTSEKDYITAKLDNEGRVMNRGEGIIIIEGAKIPIKVRASKKAHKLITTEPGELKEIKTKERASAAD